MCDKVRHVPACSAAGASESWGQESWKDDEKAQISNWYNRIPHPAPYRHETGIKTALSNTVQSERLEDSSFPADDQQAISLGKLAIVYLNPKQIATQLFVFNFVLGKHSNMTYQK